MYSTGRKNVYLDTAAVLSWILNAWVYAIVICMIYYYALYPSYQSYGLFEFGTSVFMGLFLSLQAKVAFLHHQWAYPHAIIMFISIGGLFLFLYVLSLSSDYDSGGYYGIASYLYGDSLFWWFSVFTVPIIVILIDALSYLIYFFFFPTDEMKFREIDRHVRPLYISPLI
jgi:hypothetical protein